MTTYRPPLSDIKRALSEVGTDELFAFPVHDQAGAGAPTELLEEFARLATEVLLPTDRVGDRQGVCLDPVTGAVTTPEVFKSAWARYVEGGWGGISSAASLGGGGFPSPIGTAIQELFASANLAFSLAQVLTQGAVELLARWGTPHQQAHYLPHLLTGEWTGTMDLTEPDAGSDVGAISTRAIRQPDDTWRVTGTKIFITWGEHDLADDIIHAVLARTPGSPAGTKGISLFLVPKVLPDGTRNAMRCIGLEHKLGIHASPTCVMQYDNAVGELIGPEHGGMRAMFTMMNAARLAIAVEGLATGERAHQQALAYARERRQGRAPGGPAGIPSPIINHPDVQRMLLDLRASTRAMRLMLFLTSAAGDRAQHCTDAHSREAAQCRADLLTPIAKAWSTDTGFRLASLAIQVHGGSGYIEETGIAQRLRDGRIAMIYEGTNGIQAIDLVTRKVLRDAGMAMNHLLSDVDATAAELGRWPDLQHALINATAELRAASDWLLAHREDETDVLAGATRTCS